MVILVIGGILPAASFSVAVVETIGDFSFDGALWEPDFDL
jgi:hypothetical protein